MNVCYSKYAAHYKIIRQGCKFYLLKFVFLFMNPTFQPIHSSNFLKSVLHLSKFF